MLNFEVVDLMTKNITFRRRMRGNNGVNQDQVQDNLILQTVLQKHNNLKNTKLFREPTTLGQDPVPSM